MVEDGSLKKSDRKTFREADALPGVMVIKATRLDDGDLIGEPENWKGDGAPPQLLIFNIGPRDKKRGKRDQSETLKVGDRALCRIKVRENGEAVATVMKKLGSGPTALSRKRPAMITNPLKSLTVQKIKTLSGSVPHGAIRVTYVSLILPKS